MIQNLFFIFVQEIYRTDNISRYSFALTTTNT